MEDKASNLDAVLKEAVDLVRATLSSLPPRFACLFLLSRLLLGLRAVGAAARRRALLLCSVPSSCVRRVLPRSADFLGVRFRLRGVGADVSGFCRFGACRLPAAAGGELALLPLLLPVRAPRLGGTP